MSAIPPVFDRLHLQAAMLDVVAATHAPPSLVAQRQQQRLVRLLEAARGSALYRTHGRGRTPARFGAVAHGAGHAARIDGAL